MIFLSDIFSVKPLNIMTFLYTWFSIVDYMALERAHNQVLVKGVSLIQFLPVVTCLKNQYENHIEVAFVNLLTTMWL